MGHYPVLDGRPNSVALSAVPAGSGTNTKGPWSQLIAATTYDVDLLAIQVRSAGTDQNALMDIGVGAAASEVVIVPNLYDSYDGLVSDISRSNGFILCPVSIPNGSRIAIRCQASVADGIVLGRIVPCGGGFRRLTPLGKITDYGTDTANSRGTAVTSGSADFGSWVQLAASTSRTIHALAAMAGCISYTAGGDTLVQIGVGANGSEISVMEMGGQWRTSAVGGSNGLSLGFLPCLIPAGTRLSARVNSTNTDVYYVIAYGAS